MHRRFTPLPFLSRHFNNCVNPRKNTAEFSPFGSHFLSPTQNSTSALCPCFSRLWLKSIKDLGD
jgi:hypothetical protein